jgi:type I restriction enzyme, R subunit
LSRLNRMLPGKENPFVLDFVNEAEDIYKAFKPYYDATSLQEVSDPSQLDKLKHELDSLQVYFWSEVEAFARVFYRPPAKQTAADHARIHQQLQPAVDRFTALAADELRDTFREKLFGYVRVYSFLSQIMPYADPDLEMFYSYGRLLLPQLPSETKDPVRLADEVSLQYYRLQRVFSGAIELHEDVEDFGVKSPTDVGSRKAKDEKAPLSEIIELLNGRFGTNFTDEDRLFFEQIKEKAANNPQVIQLRLANPFDKFQLGLRKLIEDLMIQRMGENDRIVTRYLDDKAFESAAFAVLSKVIYESIPANENGAG